jgi:tetratricopeptide (TPR) repeat protein
LRRFAADRPYEPEDLRADWAPHRAVTTLSRKQVVADAHAPGGVADTASRRGQPLGYAADGGRNGMAQSKLEHARAAYAERDWDIARDRFREAHAEAPLGTDDLAALADCSWWLGDIDQCLLVQQEVYRLHLEAGRAADAALMALEIAYTLSLRGEQAQASGWMSRGVRHLADEPEGPAHGYLGYIAFEEAFWGGDLATALAQADQVHALGARHGDANLVALGVLGRGRVLVKQGRLGEGMTLLDEAMLAAVSDELDPGWAGNIYCHLMLACFEIADLRRAGEWTEATASWCERMPGAGPFLGICRVHRAQLLVVHGAWADAEREVTWVRDRFAHFDVEIVAESHYQLGELRRRRGDLDAAEASYRQAHALGRDPQPGLALVRLARDRLHCRPPQPGRPHRGVWRHDPRRRLPGRSRLSGLVIGGGRTAASRRSFRAGLRRCSHRPRP